MKSLPLVYLASGWFSPEQKRQMDEVYVVLKAMEVEGEIGLFAPFHDGIVLKGKSDPGWKVKMKEVWELDIRKLSSSRLVVVLTQDHDVGTIFEAGYGSAKGIPLLCYNSKPELGLNVMLSQEARGFVKSPDALGTAVQSFIRAYAAGEDTTWKLNEWEGEPM